MSDNPKGPSRERKRMARPSEREIIKALSFNRTFAWITG